MYLTHNPRLTLEMEQRGTTARTGILGWRAIISRSRQLSKGDAESFGIEGRESLGRAKVERMPIKSADQSAYGW
jgi:hypothetical protein